MNKKLLFGIMSLAALAACTNDDFDSQQQVAEGTSPIQFEVINNNASMRASMDDETGNTVVWSADDGDLFTLYHGADYTTPAAVTGYQNATYKANKNEGGVATLTTPSVILSGSAIMVWPVDTTFSIKSGDNLSIKIPAEQGGKDEKGNEIIQNQIPYVSDLIKIEAYAAYNEDATKGAVTAYNTAGKDRKYSVYMRPMASQLNLKADYAGSDATIAELYEGGKDNLTGEDAIDPIKVTSVDLLTTAAGTTKFTTKIPLKFADPTGTQGTNWDEKAPNNAWAQVTDFDVDGIADVDKVDKLTTKCLLAKNEGCKFLILPQKTIGGAGVAEGAVVVNTNYGKVIVAPESFGTNKGKYKAPDEIKDAWYRITDKAVPQTTADIHHETAATTAETKGDFKGKFKTSADVANGLAQVIDAFSINKPTKEGSIVLGEPTGAAGTRYVKVLLKYLDMTDLHVKTDKQLRDAARVWKKMGLDPVTVYLDGDANKEFAISQKTIEVINGINGAYNATTNPTQKFQVKPCKDTDEKCTKIIITGSDYKQDVQDIAFIVDNGGTKADVVLAKETKAWKWNGTVKVAKAGVNQIVNKGTMENGATATLKTVEFNEAPNNVKLRNEGTWNITAGTLNVQFDVTNIKEVNISKGAQYRQDGAEATYFTNTAVTLPQRFLKGDAKEMIGVVNNYGVFASVNKGGIVNYGLIEHADKDAKTYILRNQQGGNFNNAFDTSSNRMGRINLPFDNKDEDNISISAAAAEGFVSVTVTAGDAPTDGILNADVVGKRVNYIIVNGGINKIAAVSDQVKYIEINDPSKKQPNEIVWSVANSEYEGLIVLSDVNIKLNTTINVTKAAYLGADMYVGGTLKYKGGAITDNLWKGYYGDTSDNFATKYITY